MAATNSRRDANRSGEQQPAAAKSADKQPKPASRPRAAKPETASVAEPALRKAAQPQAEASVSAGTELATAAARSPEPAVEAANAVAESAAEAAKPAYDVAGAAVALSWPVYAGVSQRVLAAWAEMHVQLVETAFAVAEQQVAELQEMLDETVQTARAVGEAGDAPEQLRLQLEHAGRVLNRAVLGTTQRYGFVVQRQTETVELLARRTAELWGQLQASDTVELDRAA
jgi:phasin family protein